MKIKNLPFLLFSTLFVFSLTFNSCKKDYDPLESLPQTFTKKVLIEEFTAEWCAACANAFPRIQTVLDENPNKVFAAIIHHNDAFGNSQAKTIKTAFGISSFPSSMVDRFAFGNSNPRVYPSTSRLRSRSETRMKDKATTGLKIETEILENGKANVTVTVGHNEKVTNAPKLTVYLLEDNLPAVNQSGTSDPDYKHHHVLRKVLTEAKGDFIIMDAQERDFHIRSFEGINISEYDSKNLEVIAFIHYFDNNSLANHEIVNVQYVKLGENQDWD